MSTRHTGRGKGNLSEAGERGQAARRVRPRPWTSTMRGVLGVLFPVLVLLLALLLLLLFVLLRAARKVRPLRSVGGRLANCARFACRLSARSASRSCAQTFSGVSRAHFLTMFWPVARHVHKALALVVALTLVQVVDALPAEGKVRRLRWKVRPRP